MASITERFEQATATHREGKHDQAIAEYRQILADDPGHAQTWCNLGVALVRQGKVGEAIQAYQSAIRFQPNYTEAYFNLGNAYRRAERPAEASGAYLSAMRGEPKHLPSIHNLALCYAALGRWAEALKYHRLSVDIDPHFAEGYNHLGDVEGRLGNLTEALRAFETFVKLRPSEARGHHNLGLFLHRIGRSQNAIAALRYSLQLQPDYAEGHNTLGVILESLDQVDEAYEHYRKALQIQPQHLEAMNNLANLEVEQANHEGAIQLRRGSMQVHTQPIVPHVHSNLLHLLNYPAYIQQQSLFEEHLQWSKLHAAEGYGRTPVSDDDVERVLRVGYVSSDFRNHSALAFLEPLFRHHDRDRIHLIALPTIEASEAGTRRLQGYSDEWLPLAGHTDDAAAEIVREAKIDILVDLNGHSAGNRLGLFSRRPAPLQVSLFGYPATTGLAAIDYKISCMALDPPGQSEAYFTETLWRLPEVAWCYQPSDAAKEVSPSPVETAGVVTFGSTNRPAKLTPRMIQVWSRILEAVPQSRMVVLSGRGGFGVGRLRTLFAKQKIDTDRLIFIPRQPTDRYFELYQMIDIALDPSPYGGGMTTCDSLYMGVPVLSLEGESSASRQGKMILESVGLDQWVARDEDELVNKAAEFANQPAMLKELRESLRGKMDRSPMLDAAGYVKTLEGAYREMWRRLLAER